MFVRTSISDVIDDLRKYKVVAYNGYDSERFVVTLRRNGRYNKDINKEFLFKSRRDYQRFYKEFRELLNEQEKNKNI